MDAKLTFEDKLLLVQFTGMEYSISSDNTIQVNEGIIGMNDFDIKDEFDPEEDLIQRGILENKFIIELHQPLIKSTMFNPDGTIEWVNYATPESVVKASGENTIMAILKYVKDKK